MGRRKGSDASEAGYRNKWDRIFVRAVARRSHLLLSFAWCVMVVRPEPSEQRVLMARDGIYALWVTKLREL